ncbi:MAG: bifunctional homocysteine S-methyltransferase/methylenetetrahydrofolate reductase [Thermoleophilia bacterium]
MSRFLERLAAGGVIVADGGMGTVLERRVARLRCAEEANVREPEAVLGVHLAFIRAGAELIEANTFGANRYRLAQSYLDDRLEEIVERGVKLAREAREVSGVQVLIGGSIGPLGDVDAPLPRALQEDAFAEQARLLEGRGVDLFVVETFVDLDELVVAVEAVRSISSLPVIAQLSFDEGAETVSGVGAHEAAERLAGLGVAAVGANCGLGPQAALEAIADMAGAAEGAGLPLSIMPNVGLPSRAEGRITYPGGTPDYFAELAAQARTLGARVIGGCCGTTPAQIAAVKAAVVEDRAPRVPFVAFEREVASRGEREERQTLLQRRLEAGDWVVSVELDPPKGANLQGLLEVARALRESGVVDMVDVNDNPMARARMSALVASATIEQAVGIETIPHVTPRDATIMGLESQLLGAHAGGVRNVLAVTGDPPRVGDHAGSSGVYEVDSIGLTAVLSRLNEGEDWAGKSIDAPTSFFVGVAVNPSADDLDVELERFRRKVDAGARFAMTQALFDLEYLDRFLDALGGESPIPLLLGVWPLNSFQLAFRLHNEVPGIIVPEPVQQALADAGADAKQVGLELARELYEAARSRCAGVYVIPPFKEPLAALALLQP